LSFHAGIVESVGQQRFSKFVSVHTVAHPFEQMTALTATNSGGIFERFPTMRLSFVKSAIGWVPYMMDRMDE